MFKSQRSGNGVMLLGMGVVLAVWMAAAGLMFKSYHEGGASEQTCQLVCASNQVARS